MANEQGGIIRLGQLSSFHNFSTNYSHLLLESKWAFNSSLNFTHSTIGVDVASTYGTTLGASRKFLKEKLITQLSSAINQSVSDNFTTQNLNFRLTTSYKLFDQHNFNLSASQIFSNSSGTTPKPSINEITITFGYNYNFGGTKKKKEKEEKPETQVAEKNTLKVKINENTYKQVHYNPNRSVKISTTYNIYTKSLLQK